MKNGIVIHCVPGPRAGSGTEETSDFYLLTIHAVGRLKWKGQLSSSSSNCQVPQRSFLIHLQQLCLWFIRIRKITKRGTCYWALTDNQGMNQLLWEPKVESNQLSGGGRCLSIKVSQFCCQWAHWTCPHRHRKAEFGACPKVQCTGSRRYLWGPQGHGREALVAAEKLEAGISHQNFKKRERSDQIWCIGKCLMWRMKYGEREVRSRRPCSEVILIAVRRGWY